MKKLIYSLMALFAAATLYSCCGFEEVDMGYPQSVNFTKDGGEKNCNY